MNDKKTISISLPFQRKMIAPRLVWQLLWIGVILLISSLLPFDVSQATPYAMGKTASWRTFDCLALDELSWERSSVAVRSPVWENREPYVRPEFADRMRMLRPTILAAAARHNQPQLSGMSDMEFAEVIALVLYNEHFGWLEDALPWLRVATPIYQQVQIAANLSGAGANYSVWPSNLRPSVALEIIRQQLPLPTSATPMTIPLQVKGSTIDPERYQKQAELFAALTTEIIQDDLAVEYLAANLERGMYRAAVENVPISWQVLASWHNQGIVHPDQILANRSTREYVCRASAYRPIAHQFIEAVKAQKLSRLSPLLPDGESLPQWVSQ